MWASACLFVCLFVCLCAHVSASVCCLHTCQLCQAADIIRSICFVQFFLFCTRRDNPLGPSHHNYCIQIIQYVILNKYKNKTGICMRVIAWLMTMKTNIASLLWLCTLLCLRTLEFGIHENRSKQTFVLFLNKYSIDVCRFQGKNPNIDVFMAS